MPNMSKYDEEFNAQFEAERAPLLDEYSTMPKTFTCTCRVTSSDYCLKHNRDLTLGEEFKEDDFLIKVDL